MEPVLSFEKCPDFFSRITVDVVEPNSRESFKALIKDSYEYIVRYFSLLSAMDHNIARLYYIEGMSQDQISDLVGISQAAVSRRLKYILDRVKFLLKMPSLDPILVREELGELFPPELFEFAYFFYWELVQNRVKFFIKTSQSGAAHKFQKIVEYLEKIEAKEDIEERTRYLALIYLDYFRFIKESNTITYLCKKNDSIRSNSLVLGESILN